MTTINSISEVCEEENQTEEIVFAVLEGDDDIPIDVEGVDNQIHDDPEELAGNIKSDIREPETLETVEAKTRFFRQFLERVFESIDNDVQTSINDTVVNCGINGDSIRVPALLLASVSPVFKRAGILTEAETQALVLPDVDIHDFRTFLRHLCSYQLDTLNPDNVGTDDDSLKTLEAETDAVKRVMDVLCVEFRGSDDPVDSLFLLDHDWVDIERGAVTGAEAGRITLKPPEADEKPATVTSEHAVTRRRPGRKRGQKINVNDEPYVKTEVMETFRTTGASYSLRQTIKRKRFADLVSDSELGSDSGDDVISSDPTKKRPKSSLDKSNIDEYLKEDSDVYVPENETDDDDDDFDVDVVQDDEIVVSDEVQEEEEEEELLFYDEADQRQIDGTEPGPEVEEDPNAPSLFSVFFGSDGQVEIVKTGPESSSLLTNVNKYSRPKRQSSDKSFGIKRIVSIIDDNDASIQTTFDKSTTTTSDPATTIHPRSLLKPKKSDSNVPLILVCSVCQFQCHGQSELKRHAARNHPGSKLFLLSTSNPHRQCVPCSTMMQSYERLFADPDDVVEMKNICFPCPHCRRRYLGGVGGLATHLMTDHRQAIEVDLLSQDEFYYEVMKRDDPRVLTCDFCHQGFPHTIALNKHLLTCPSNTSGHSAGLFCHICGKMFAQTKILKDHLLRHGEANVIRQRSFFCPECPVACVSEVNLLRHIDREHSERNLDENFVLHENCQRCSLLYNSYLENKLTQTIPFREMVFKCPHCCMILYANQKHPPRYLYNHINKFHTDPEINNFSVGDNDPSVFRLRSKTEEETLTCEFCGFKSKTRANHNVHLSTCKSNTVPCRPGYMCDTCGFVAGTAVHLRNHLESHNDKKTYSCNKCNYSGRSRRYLKFHVLKHHSDEGAKKKKAEIVYTSCPKCGKLRREGASMRTHLRKCGTSAEKVTCPKCNMDFKRREDMEAHGLIHYGQVICPIHNILFKEESEVYLHVNVAQPEDKYPRLQCCICPKHFRHMCLFMKHLRRHLNISAYRCEICSKQVNTFASLDLHMKRLHSGPKEVQQKTFACQYCIKVFGTKGHLKEHILGVHDQSRSTLCPVCQKTFRTDKRMKKHLYNSHPDVAPHFRSQNKLETFILEPVSLL